jgi:hypothetical protein
MTATKIEQAAFAITSSISTDLFDDFMVFMQAGDGLDAISDVTDFESYLDSMTDEMIDEIDKEMERTGSDYLYYNQAMGEFSVVNGYISAKTWKAIQSNIESVFLAFQEQYPDDFRKKLPGELLERELLSIEHTVYSIGDDTDENSESHADVLEEKLIEHFGISDITVTFDPRNNYPRTVLVFADLDEDEDDVDLYESEDKATERVEAEISYVDDVIDGDY